MEPSVTVDILNALFRWLHIIFGIIWIGMLYFFNFVNGPFQATIDGDTKQKVNPELLPRALFWFRWGAAWTWITGVLLLSLVFYHGKQMFPSGTSWSAVSGVLVLLSFLAPFIYDFLHKTLGKDPKVFGTIGFLLIVIFSYLFFYVGEFTYRAYLIHVGVALGSTMAFNVWYRIWPLQQRILKAVKAGEKPNADEVVLAGIRSRHNVYMSVPLFYTMMNVHTTTFNIGYWAIGSLLLVVLVGWHLVYQFYKRSGKLKGF